MPNKRNRRRRGFTLVEIMIVAAMIALLAAIALPNFLRARKRAQAGRVLEDLRVLNMAKSIYSVENNVNPAETVTFENLKPFIKSGVALYRNEGMDVLGHAYNMNLIDEPMTIANATYANFSDVVDDDFWGSHR